jgi:copper chaperone
MQTEQLKVTGMTCGGCTSKVAHALKAVNGVNDVQVSLAASEATVQFDEKLTSPEQLKLAVRQLGYGIETTNPSPAPKGKSGCCG